MGTNPAGGDGKSQTQGGEGKAGMGKIRDKKKENSGFHPDGGAREAQAATPGTRDFQFPPNPFFSPDPRSRIRPVP